ncbi:Phage shock protein A [Candidatus Entotheonellaceae bacterium PAL068K]
MTTQPEHGRPVDCIVLMKEEDLMGIFTRVRDIINANVNAMLDRAEDPEKLIRLMIQEMEDTLVEVKASCAGAMATKKRVQRELEQTLTRARQWGDRARLAVDKDRENLAREALLEKRRYQQQAEALDKELIQCDALVEQYQDEIMQLGDKLNTARDKQRLLVQRHRHAQQSQQAQRDIQRLDSTDVVLRFEQFENRIERMEAEATLVNYGRKPRLEEAFALLEGDDDIEQELQALKATAAKRAQDNPLA